MHTMHVRLIRMTALTLVASSSIAFAAPVLASGSMLQSLTQYRLWLLATVERKLLSKRVHAIVEGRSWGGMITRVYYSEPTPPVDENFDKLVLRNIYLEIKTLIDEGNTDTVRVPLSALSGIAKDGFPNAHIAASTRLEYGDEDITTPMDMILAGFPNIVLTAYDDGYLEVFVEGVVEGKHTAAVVYVRFDDIMNNPDLHYRKGSF